MRPAFKEELEYNGIDAMYEGYLWVSNRAYRGFRKNGKPVIFGRDTAKLPKDMSKYLTHEEICDMHYRDFTSRKVLQEKEDFAMYLKYCKKDYDSIVVNVSGGKDSTVMEHIIRDIYKLHSHELLFINSSNETHHTYKYIKENYKGIKIISPKEGFYNWVKRQGFIPSKLSRACCDVFKEGNLTASLDTKKKLLHVCGIRSSESPSRSAYEKVRKGNWRNADAQKNWDMYLPVIDFDDMDIWSYLIVNGVPFNEMYRFGYNRVGCTICPYRSRYELGLNEHFLPTYDRRWKAILEEVFIGEGLAINLNATLEEFLGGAWIGGTVREEPTYEVIKSFADTKGIEYNKAERYFKSNRCSCGKRLSKDIIALNMKTLGRTTEARMCIKCLSEFTGATKKELLSNIESFKSEGCNLF